MMSETKFLTWRQAQKDAEILRSVVVPLEKEIASLKEKLQNADIEKRALEHKLKVRIGAKYRPKL